MWTPAAWAELARASLAYATCLSDAEWAVLAPALPALPRPAPVALAPALLLRRHPVRAARDGTCRWISRPLARCIAGCYASHRRACSTVSPTPSRWPTASGSDARSARLAVSLMGRSHPRVAWCRRRADTSKNRLLGGLQAVLTMRATLAWTLGRLDTSKYRSDGGFWKGVVGVSALWVRAAAPAAGLMFPLSDGH